MKKILLFLLAVLLFSGVSHATWVDFYMVTTGSDTNSGSGTGNSADVTSTNGNWGGSATLGRFTAASGTPFSAVTVGQMASVYLDTAASAVFVSSVIAVNGGGASIDVDTTTIKWGTSPSTATTGRSCKIGGAWASLAVVTSLFPSGTAPQSTRINIKAGTYANAATARTFGMSGTTAARIWWRGYQTSPGDQETNNVAVAGTNIPTFTFTTAIMTVQGSYQVLSSIDVTGSAATAGQAQLNGTGGNNFYYRVRVTNTSSSANGIAINFGTTNIQSVSACYFKATATASKVVAVGTNSTFLSGCTIVGGITGISFTAGQATSASFCVFDSQAGDAITWATTAACYLFNLSIYNPTGNGINFTSVPIGGIVANSYFENVNQASKAAINNTTGTTGNLMLVGNAYFNCTSNIAGISENQTIFDNGTLGSAAFTTPGSQNFSIGSVAKALGFPGTFENISAYQGYLDVGAVQRQEKGTTTTFIQ